jgi:putative transposase
MMPVLMAIWVANYRVYGAHKLWKAALRAGHVIGRDQVVRLMRELDIRGVRRGRRWITTRPGDAAERAPDLVRRDFTATAPNQLWVTDLTYVATWSGVAYVCFIVDAFSRDDRQLARRAHAHRDGPRRVGDGPLVARRLARGPRRPLRRRQYTSIRYGERLADLGATPSIGTVGDSFDNALAETTNGLYKAELIRGPDQGPWRGVDDVELATLGWVHWYNTERLHGYLGDVPPTEYEAAFYAAQQTDHTVVGIQ